MADLRVTVDGIELEANWTDDAPQTRAALAATLPVAGEAARWGEELYFTVPVDADSENAREVVPEGSLAYWPAGNALCLFWGATPASQNGEPRAASPVNLLARIPDPSPLSAIDGGARVRVEHVDE